MVRTFVIRTKPWKNGLEIHIFEGGAEFGVTQTPPGFFSEDSVRNMAHEYIQVSEDLQDDESYDLMISSEPLN